MSIGTFKATVKKKEGLAVEVESRGFKVNVDQPESVGGSNTGMNPVELLLGSLGACQTITAISLASHYKIDLKDLWVELEGDLDLDSLSGSKPQVEKGFKNIRFNFHVKSDSPEKKVKELVSHVEKICPVLQTLLKNVRVDKAKVTMEN
ncbi:MULTISPECIES: OsmC family protein [unclassified Clostridium]|jgi:uncharacterized OsmC-like protein|uniref:OsmC family protein n=1 Tax=unclassified Clostridium TaxID=2614128 RepID=UPI0015F5320C|nr:OsmC family protein [Clostridium sp. cel8]MBA5851566.1 OsmC family protein [Clostridium sp. cel8]